MLVISTGRALISSQFEGCTLGSADKTWLAKWVGYVTLYMYGVEVVFGIKHI